MAQGHENFPRQLHYPEKRCLRSDLTRVLVVGHVRVVRLGGREFSNGSRSLWRPHSGPSGGAPEAQ